MRGSSSGSLNMQPSYRRLITLFEVIDKMATLGNATLLRVVDLGALEGVAGVDVDGLPGGVEVERAEAFAVSVAGLLDAAEGQVDFRADGGGVDVGDAGFEVADGGEGAVDVLGVERGREAVVDGVGDLDGFFKSRE